MRIDRLHIQSFGNLGDFEVDFHVTSWRQVVVGRNGVGKSNLLEAITWIFRDLDLEKDPSFGYEIEYHCNNHYVRIKSTLIKAEKEGDGQYKRTYWVAAATAQPSESITDRPYVELKQSEFYKLNRPVEEEHALESPSGRRPKVPNPKRLLPLYVVGYYSGVSQRLYEAFEAHEKRYYREQIEGTEAPLRSLFLAKPHHSQFSLLSFFAAPDAHAEAFLKEELRIDGLASVLFTLHEPYWRKGKDSPKGTGQIDRRFWRAKGQVSSFLSSLFEHSFAPMSGAERRTISIGRHKTFETRYCYLPDERALRAVAADLSPREFFARLESTIFSDVLSSDGTDLQVRVRLKNQPVPVLFKQLSEGEQQLLTIIGLMRFTAEKESLFLLDEPDTALNPAWCLDFMKNLEEYGVNPDNSQIIMTTHSPLTFAGLDSNEVVVLERDSDGKVWSKHPITAPKGMGFQAILTSDYFGLRSALDSETLVLLDEKRTLAIKNEKNDTDRARLGELNELLGQLDFSKAARDPLYLEFIRAMTTAQLETPAIGSPAPSAPDWKLRKQVAKDIASKISNATKPQ
jgi:predicted ATPase